jgi:hypothetical protein
MFRRFAYPAPSVIPLTASQKDCLQELIHSVDKRELTFEPTSCPCGARNDETISQVDRLGMPLTYVICRECGLIRADLLPVMPSFMGRVCSGYAPGWGLLQTRSV